MVIDYNEKYQGYIGIDEVARGNFFGPSLFVGVCLKVPYNELSFAVDSKTTTKEQRKELYDKIITFWMKEGALVDPNIKKT